MDAKGSAKSTQMGQYSGLSIANGLHGELVMPRVDQEFVAVLKPKYAPGTAPFVVAVTPRRGIAGQTVIVTGDNFATGLTATFGAAPCTAVALIDKNAFKCKVPAGTGVVSVIVKTAAGTSKKIAGGDFIYT